MKRSRGLPAGMDPEVVRKAVLEALEEDSAHDDVTVSFLGIGQRGIAARMLALSPGVLAGIDVARMAFHETDPRVAFGALVEDGTRIEEGQLLARIRGEAGGILSAERVALNFLQRLSGIATLTSKYVRKIAGTGVRILDTRKTTPRLRELEKYAVRVGGGENHRFDLKEMVLVKENHIRAVGGTDALLERLRRERPSTKVEVEVDSLDGLNALLGLPADRLMLDNLPPEEVREAARRIGAYRKRHPEFSPEVEVSGGITLDNITQYAVPGVDFISIGALTHSAPALDISLEVD